jgi:Tol biopolymer transport system component
MFLKSMTLKLIISTTVLIMFGCDKATDPPQVTIPVLTTTTVTGITSSSATSGGNITSDGGATVTARGVCWSTNSAPTVTDSRTTDGSGTGSFTSTITGLDSNTTYNVRAYATNSAGTGYGGSRTFFTTSANNQLKYLGQTPPGNTPIRFSTGEFLSNANWGWHGAPEFAPDGQEMFFTVMDNLIPSMKIYYTKILDGRWSSPAIASFSQEGGCSNPRFSSDGNSIYFIRRGGPDFLYKVVRTENGWSGPILINIAIPKDFTFGWQFSMTNDESIYFELWSANSQKIFFSKKVDGRYISPQLLFPTNTSYAEYAPYIDPDEKYIIFVSNRPGGYGRHDLEISFKNSDGSWSEWINLGSNINTSGEDWMPNVSPDGLYFFFVTSKPGDAGDNPYWVNIQVIENLRP